jgi:hypothetical protein
MPLRLEARHHPHGRSAAKWQEPATGVVCIELNVMASTRV